MLVITSDGAEVYLPKGARLDYSWTGEFKNGCRLYAVEYWFDLNKRPVVLGRYIGGHSRDQIDHLRYNLETGRVDQYSMPPDDECDDVELVR